MNSDLNKQAQALEVTFSGKTKSSHLNDDYMSFYEFRSKQTGSGSTSYIFNENKIISLSNLFQQDVKNFSE